MTGGEIDYGNPANSINPDDIENIVVLKGDNASALYGSDAANGAILITTKKAGQRSGLGVTYSTNVQFTEFSQYPIYQNIYGGGHINRFENNKANSFNGDVKVPYDPNMPYGIQRMGGYDNSRSWGMPMLGFQVVGRNGELKSYVPTPANTTSMYQTAYSWTNSVSIERATEHVSTRIGFTNLRSDDVLEGLNNLTRNAFNVRSNVKLTKSLDVDLNGRYTHENVKNRSYRNNSDRNPIYTLMDMPRDLSIQEMYPWKDENGKPTALQFKSPVWMLNELSNQDKKEWLLADVTVNYKITKDLKLRLKAALDLNMKEGYEFRNMYTPGDADGFYKEFTEKSRNYTYEAMLSYNKTWKDFNISASVGANSQDFLFKKQNSEIGTLATSDFISLTNNGATVKSWPEYNAKKKQAVYGTASIGYKDFIYVDVTGRNDWSSTLVYADGHGSYSYFYPSVNGSWLISSTYRDQLPEWISFAKIRGSWAQVGNDTSPYIINTAYQINTSTLNGTNYYGMSLPGTMYDQDLKPERKNAWEIGLDWRFLNNRIGLDATYYKENTKDQIMEISVPAVSGITKQLINAGNIQNKGVELALNTIPFQNQDWEWTLDFTWTKNMNKIVELHENVADYITLAGDVAYGNYRIGSVAKVGASYGTLMTDSYYKFDKSSGLPMLVWTDGTRRSHYLRNEAKIVEIGSMIPDFLGSISTGLKYKNWSLNISLDMRFGGKVASYNSRYGTAYGFMEESLKGTPGHGGVTWTSKFDGKTYNDGIIPQGIIPQGTQITQPDGSIYTVGAGGVSSAGQSYQELFDKGVIEPTHASAWTYRNNAWTMAGRDYGVVNNSWVEDLNYIALCDISLSYRLPSTACEKIKAKHCVLTLNGHNLGYLLNSLPNNINPESVSGTAAAEFRIRSLTGVTSSFTFTVNVGF